MIEMVVPFYLFRTVVFYFCVPPGIICSGIICNEQRGIQRVGLIVYVDSTTSRSRCATGIQCLEPAVFADLMTMALRYTARELLNLKQNPSRLAKDSYDRCRDAGLLRLKRYIHRGSMRSFTASSSPSICISTCRFKTNNLFYTGIDQRNLILVPRVEIKSLLTPFHSSAYAALFNARSVNNKALFLSDFILDKKLDFLFLTETWHKENDGLLFNQITPVGFGTLDLPRLSGRGGGIIVVYNLQFKISPVSVSQFSSFECLVLSISAPTSTIIATVYKPPKTTHEAFISEFAEFLSMLSLKFHRILIVGDFNMHVDRSDSAVAKEFLSLLDCLDFSQLVTGPTHCKYQMVNLYHSYHLLTLDCLIIQLFSLIWRCIFQVCLQNELQHSGSGSLLIKQFFLILLYPL